MIAFSNVTAWRLTSQAALLAEPQSELAAFAVTKIGADWLMTLHYIEFLRDVGRYFSVNQMLAAEAYRTHLALASAGNQQGRGRVESEAVAVSTEGRGFRKFAHISGDNLP